ncbi:hypothetical protein ACLOJK_039066 [Asimina triloba]
MGDVCWTPNAGEMDGICFRRRMLDDQWATPGLIRCRQPATDADAVLMTGGTSRWMLVLHDAMGGMEGGKALVQRLGTDGSATCWRTIGTSEVDRARQRADTPGRSRQTNRRRTGRASDVTDDDGMIGTRGLTFSSMRRRFLSQVFYVGILQTCYAKQADACFSSCDNILNISYPFRLNGDPLNRGQSNIFKQTIRLVDHGLQSGNCSSSSLHSAIVDELSYGDPYSTTNSYDVITYVNRSAYLYVVLSPTNAHVSDLLPSCQVVAKADVMAAGLKRAKRFSELSKMGFELS